MLKRIFRHIRREPLPCVAVFLFAAILSLILCILRQTRVEEMANYEKAYDSVPVYFTVTNLDGTQPDDTIEGWAANLYYPESNLEPSFSEYVKDMALKMTYSAHEPERGSIDVIGVSSFRMLPELTEGYGGSVTWVVGYDESLFASDESACLVPEGYTEDDEIILNFDYIDQNTYEHWHCTQSFTVAGYFTSRGTDQIYCPYDTLAKVQSTIHAPYDLIGISAMLNDNTRLEELRQAADHWFARPNKTGKPTPWGHYGYEHYPYALDIDDSLLQSLNATMERSMTVNRLSALAIFLLSAGAGFLVGFLMIRSRKREIMLMRTLGCTDQDIYREFTAEQMLCAATGTVLGGGYALWQPVDQLCLFLGIYFVGLSLALVFFLRKNLLTTIKEDE